MEFRVAYPNELYHHGILKQKWGIRRFQNKDGSLTPAGKKRYRKLTRKADENKLFQKVLTLVSDVEKKEMSDVPKSTVAKGRSHFMRMQQQQIHMQTHMDNTRIFNQIHMNNMNMHMNNMHMMNNINHFHHM